MAGSLRQEGATGTGVSRAARKRGSDYSGGARAGTCREEFAAIKLRCCGSGAAPVGIRTDTRAPAGAASMAWWLKWQIGQLSVEELA